MAILTFSQISDLALDRIQANVSTDPAFTSAEIARYINDAYADVWEISGGALKRVNSATAWATSPTSGTTGISTSLLTDIGEVKEVFYSTTVGSTGDITAGDKALDPVDISEIHYMRSVQSLFGSYSAPRIYAIGRNNTTTVADVNKLQLDVWPGVTGIYLPLHYVPQFAEIDAATVTTPAVSDIESRDIFLMAAAAMAPRIGRQELVPDILMSISERTRLGLERRATALMSGKQDKR